MSVEIYDNRQRAVFLNKVVDPFVRGEVVKVDSWAG